MEKLKILRRKYFGVDNLSWESHFAVISRLLNIIECRVFEDVPPTMRLRLKFLGSLSLFLSMMIFAFHTSVTTSSGYQKTEAVTACFVAFQIICQFCLTIFGKSNMRKMRNTIVNVTEMLQNAKGKNQEIGVKYRKITNIVLCGLIFPYLVGFTIYISLPFFKSGDWELPMAVQIIGISYQHHPQYELNYLLNGMQMGCGAIFITCHNALLFLFCAYVSMIIELNIYHCSLIGDKNSEHDTEEKQEHLLKNIALIQRGLLEFLSTYKATVEMSNLVKILTIGGVVCFSIVQVIADNSAIACVIAIIQLFELLLYSVVGQIIISKNEQYSRSIYCSKWYELENSSNRKMMLLLLAKSQVEDGLPIGGFSNLSFQTFTGVLQAVYSYVTFLINMKNN